MENVNDVTLGDLVSLIVRYIWQIARRFFYLPAAMNFVPAVGKRVRFGSRTPIESSRHPFVSPHICQHPVDLYECVDALIETISNTVDMSSNSEYRKAPLLLSRCSRGGKTSMFIAIDAKLRKLGYATVLAIRNDVGFRWFEHESDSEALFRLITSQIDSSLKINEKRVCDWPALDKYIGGQKRFVLLIDGINMIGQPVSCELAAVLKEYFLDKAGRHLIMGSHIPMGSLGDRAVHNVQMPTSFVISELKLMSKSLCGGITPAFAAYYGGIPSLMYAVLDQLAEAPRRKFRGRTCSNVAEFNTFVTVLLTGKADPAIVKYLRYCSEVSIDQRVRWPLCYIHCIMDRCQPSYIAQHIRYCFRDLERNMHMVGDDTVWEASTRIAILLRAALAVSADGKMPGPLGVCGAGEAVGANVNMKWLGAGVKTLARARVVMARHADESRNPSLVLFVPTEATFERFDGFVCLIRGRQIVSTSTFQCYKNTHSAVSKVPEWITGGAHLLCANAVTSWTVQGRNAHGWYYYSQADTDEFLGWSLQIRRRQDKMAGNEFDAPRVTARASGLHGDAVMIVV